MSWLLFLAQSVEVGLLKSILDGGVPLLLLVAVTIVGWLYKKEKEEHSATIAAHAKQVADMQDKYTDKMEELYKQRIESETENAKVILRATEVLESVDGTLARTNETLDNITE